MPAHEGMKAPALLLTIGFIAALPAKASEGRVVPQIQGNEDAALIFDRLLEEAKGIDPLLHTVTDKTSAEAAAAELRPRIDRMQTLLRLLEKAPVGPATEQSISTQMSTLTRVTQGVLPTIQRLVEVNAYGSDRLLDILRHYLASRQDMGGVSEIEELPVSRLYEEMCDNLVDALYLMHKAQDPDSAQAAAASLKENITAHRRHQSLIRALTSGQGERQHPLSRTTKERLDTIREELKQEESRLRHAGFYSTPSLETLVQEYISALP